MFCSNLYSQKTYVFVGSYNWDKSKSGIYIYELDTIIGRLREVSNLKEVLNPSYLNISPNGKFIYACTEAKMPNLGSVSSFEFNSKNGNLTFLNSQKSGGENPVYLAVDKSGTWLINGNYTEGSVSVFPIDANGKINSIVQNIHYQGGSINKERQDRSHVHSTVFSPDYKYVFLPDLGSDKIRSYPFDSAQNEPLQITKESFIKSILGSGPRHFIFHPNGKFAYCIEELTGTISVYDYENGKLDSIQRINNHSEKYKENFNSADIHISPDGLFLYASNRGKENNIAIFSIQKNGFLKTIGYQSTYGKTPRNFTINASGNFLIVANQASDNLVVFNRNSKTGLLKKLSVTMKIKNPTCIQIRQY